jgi:thymidylate kinase
MKLGRGCFVVLEGIDGSGTTTQAKARRTLAARFFPKKFLTLPAIRWILVSRLIFAHS